MKNLLITEINRIQEIMGIDNSKTLILEATKNPFTELWSSAINFFKKYEPTNLPINYRSVRLGGIDVPRPTYTAIKNFLNTRNWDLLTRINARNLGTILSQDLDYVNKIYQSQFRTAMDNLKMTEQELIKKINDELPPNASPQDIQIYLRDLFNPTGDPANEKIAELLGAFLQPKISSRIKDFNSGKFVPEIYNAEGFLRKVAKNFELPVLQAFRTIFKNLFKDTDTLEKKIDEILSKMYQKLQAGKKVNREMRELAMTIVSMKKQADDDIENLYKLHITDNPNIPQKFKDELEKEDLIKQIKTYWNEDLANSTTPILRQKVEQWLSAFPVIGWAVRGLYGATKDGKTLKNVLLEALEGVRRTFNVIAWNSPTSMKEAVINFSRTGKYATIVEKIAVYLTLHNVLIPMIIARLETYYKNSEVQKLNEQIKQIKEYCALGLISCTEEDIKMLDSIKPSDYWQDVLDEVPLLKPFRNGLEIKDIFFFTYLDELSSLLSDADEELAYKEQDVKGLVLSRLTGLKDKLNAELQERGIDPNNEQQVEEASKLINQLYDNSESGFRQYIKNATGSDTTNLEVKVPGQEGIYTFWDDKYRWKRSGASTKGKFELVQ